MCGISGFIDFNKRTEREHLVRMTDTLSHRGPDSGGYEFQMTSECNIGLGHRRLSIIDLSANGNQPFRLKDWQIVFNGEIYNYLELKAELETAGRSFLTSSDTEVLATAIDHWGEHAFTKLIGMFSFAAYNTAEELLYLVRDRVGVKPLYYHWKNGLLLFASELKAFHQHPDFTKELNPSAIAEFLGIGYIQTPNCIFADTYKLNAGSFLKLTLPAKLVSEHRYWSADDFFAKEKLDISEEEAIKQTTGLLVSSFKYRMLADVPVGVFLSGGLDSSLVTAVLQKESATKLNTITIGFNEKKYDEAVHAKKIAKYLGTNHTEYYCTPQDALEIVPVLSSVYDEPFGDSSAIPTILVSRIAAKSVKVVLSADGGDELFGGYEDYVTMVNRHRRFERIPAPVKRVANAFERLSGHDLVTKALPVKNAETIKNKFFKLLKAKDIYDSGLIFSQVFTEKEIRRLMKPGELDFGFKPKPFLFNDMLSNLLAKDFNSYLIDDILVKVDRATMSASIEGREPFLDHRLIEFVAQLPSELKIKNGEKKYLLKKILANYIPKELTDRPKMGFAIPVTKWLNDELKDFVFEYLNEDRIKKQGVFNWERVKMLLDNFYKKNNINERKIWYMLTFQLWYEKWIGF
ncbi:asparagine synthase (glutamine-hydrolyzing) [Ferruginibacter sp. HRS2-29]|uniref:asparagine synthase (glutamine-hydrolyzing) n=1 Tax=Ferruginibacter sp. HRS2-29 TaxID=2487334 RepID=UPI0020CBE7D1|nr:asparagine synthase (glutamine-hydrolyzing) [Ferruginibacter sp. HRS2-29]MCP9749916.1 asparagine synthase (glutamine-hydrolyzing) [Ferruginibacter sp. HRS2-29]